MRGSNLSRRAALLSATLVAASIVAVPAARADTFSGCPTADVNGDVRITGGTICFIPAGVTINGNLRAVDVGQLRVRGTVKGNVDATDGIVIFDGRVEGNMRQRGAGHLTIAGPVGGSVTESGVGGATIFEEGTVSGNVVESGDGGLSLSGRVGGNASERDSGDLGVQGTGRVDGNVSEQGDGGCLVLGSVGGNLDGDC
jgi:cytoskeletal protein CcmA (bactofilin family)